MQELNLLADTMKNSWTAEVELNNGEVISIWYTAWASTKHLVKRILSISSDYPKQSANPLKISP